MRTGTRVLAVLGAVSAVVAGLPTAGLATSESGVRDPVEITVDDPDAGRLGTALDLDGDTLAVGDVYAQTVPGGGWDGAAYVFVRDGAGWVEQARFVPDDIESLDEFGTSVAVSGDTLVVGAPKVSDHSDQFNGAAYVYTRTGSTWTFTKRLQPIDHEDKQRFGFSVDVEGDTMVVGARGAPGYAPGFAIVYVRGPNGWKAQQLLEDPDDRSSDDFGLSVALQGDTILVGASSAPGEVEEAGAVFAYERTGTTWALSDRLVAPVQQEFTDFGVRIALDGDTAAIADPDFSAGTGVDGRAYVFTRTGTDWTAQATLRAPRGVDVGRFGMALALHGDDLVVTGPSRNVRSPGAVYRFVREGGAWNRTGHLLSPSDPDPQIFPRELALDADTLAVSADEDTELSTGKVWVYAREGANG